VIDKPYKYVLEIVGDVSLPIRRFYLKTGVHTIGAAGCADIHIPADGISRSHARLSVLADGGAMLEDLGSTNGSFVDHKAVKHTMIADAAVLAFGTLEANLRPAGEGAAIGIAASAVAAPTVPAKDTGIAAKTMRSTRETRLLATLGAHIGPLVAGEIGREAFARHLVRDWCAELNADAIEVSEKTGVQEDHIIARASFSEPLNSRCMCYQGAAGLKICVWSDDPFKDIMLEAIMQLALEVLCKSSPETGKNSQDASSAQPPELPDPGSLNPAVLALYRTCAKVAGGNIPVLILGESGTGKEVLAQWMHACSGREGSFLALNCAALSRELLEAELFGVEKGAATGVEAREGLLERATGGTVFFDELGDMALETQAKLLRALEDTFIYRVGSSNPVAIDVRFIAATNQALYQRVEEGSFRLDLYHRLAAFDVTLPALRGRREDIPLLASCFFEHAREKGESNSPGITKAALSRLITYAWPGNIRELRNEIERATLLLDPGEPLDIIHLSERLNNEEAADKGLFTLEEALHKAEREAFRVALATAGDDSQHAMELLGLSRASYYRKLKQLGL